MPDLNADAEKWLAQFDDDDPIAIDDLREAMRFAYADAARVYQQEAAMLRRYKTSADPTIGAIETMHAAILARASKPGG